MSCKALVTRVRRITNVGKLLSFVKVRAVSTAAASTVETHSAGGVGEEYLMQGVQPAQPPPPGRSQHTLSTAGQWALHASLSACHAAPFGVKPGLSCSSSPAGTCADWHPLHPLALHAGCCCRCWRLPVALGRLWRLHRRPWETSKRRLQCVCCSGSSCFCCAMGVSRGTLQSDCQPRGEQGLLVCSPSHSAP